MENKDEYPFGNESIVHNSLQESEETWAPVSYLDMIGEQELTELTDTI